MKNVFLSKFQNLAFFLNDQYSNVGEALTNKVSKCFSKQKVETVCSMSV